MTQEEAYTHLKLPEGADMQEVRRKFAALHNDCRMRIDNAPTPRLRQLFRQQLEQVKEAYSLLNGSEGMNDTIDLPRIKRMMDETSEWVPDMEISNPVMSNLQEEQSRSGGRETTCSQPVLKTKKTFPALKNPKERTTIAIIERAVSCILAFTVIQLMIGAGLMVSYILFIIAIAVHICLSLKVIRIIWTVLLALYLLLAIIAVLYRVL
jgi:hypothetical protein